MSELQLHNLQVDRSVRRKSKRRGRGNASGHGSFSGRGIKGQKARAGGKSGLQRRALKILLHSKPKIGGFKSLRPKITTVNIVELQSNYNAGELVTPRNLVEKGLIDSISVGVKVLGEGHLTKKLNVVANAFSESAKKAILEAGGKVQLIAHAKTRKSKQGKAKK